MKEDKMKASKYFWFRQDIQKHDTNRETIKGAENVYKQALNKIKGTKMKDFTIQKDPSAGVAVWRVIDKKMGIAIGEGNSKGAAKDAIRLIIAHKLIIAEAEKKGDNAEKEMVKG